MRRAQQQFRDFNRHGHAPAKIMLAAISAVLSAIAMRGLLALSMSLLPSDSWAQSLSHQIMMMAVFDFWSATGIATFGGVASLFHELRNNIFKFSIQNALGHMVISQFAGLLVYLVAVNYEFTMPLALALCGLSGWGGAKTITFLSNLTANRLGIPQAPPP